MGTKFSAVLCHEHGIGGSGEYCGGNDANLDRINVLFMRPWTASTSPAQCCSTSSQARSALQP
jgi:hypothetical protein